MSTDVDGVSPSVAPKPGDGEGLPQSGAGIGSEWLRAEMQRRMAANRSIRGRHARRGEQPPAPRRDEAIPDAVRRRREQRRPVAPDPWATGHVSPADLPENYVPRHSVQTPGPAAEPAAPISGPIPVVRPPVVPGGGEGPVVNGQPAGNPPGPEGGSTGPSLPPAALPIRRRTGDGPGTPLQGDRGAATGPWSRPTPIVPNEPARKLGAPPDPRDAPPAPWGPPLASPPRGFVVPIRPAPAEPEADEAEPTVPGEVLHLPSGPPVAPAVPARGDTATERDAASDGDRPEEPVTAAAPQADDDAPADAPAEVVDPSDAPTDEVVAPVGDAEAGPASGGAVAPRDATAAAGPPRAGAEESRSAAAASTPVAERAPSAVPAGAAPSTEAAIGTPDESAVETTDEIADTPTAPHPIVLARRAALSGRLVGVPSPRPPEQARVVTPRPVTPRTIPVVGTTPVEPGSTRVRVVLSERKGVAHPVRTIKEVQEGTAVGELLRRDLIRSQLRITLRFAALTVFVLGALPALFALFPQIGRVHMLGLRLPWLLLGLLMYPFLVGVAWRYIRIADRVEQNFADHVQD